MNRLSLIPALIAATVLAACDGPAFFQVPISEPGQVRYDERLIGSWYSFGDDNHGVWLLRILPPEDEDRGRLDAVLSLTTVEPRTGWYIAKAFASEIDGRAYYNARITGAAGTEISDDSGMVETEILGGFDGFMIIQAEVDVDDQLSLRILSVTVPKERELKFREVTCGEDCDEKLYELSAEELIELIRSTPRDELFNIYLGPFARIETGRPVFGDEPPPPQ